MTYKRLVDPELLATLEAYPGFGFSIEALPRIRERFASRPTIDDPSVLVTETFLPRPGAEGPLRLVCYAPVNAAGPRPALLHIHGGGFVLGEPEMNDEQSKRFVRTFGCTVVSVDYRLAPETVFPGAVEDCYAALQWLFASTGELGVDPTRIAMGGESAGGGLVAAVSLMNRDRDQLPIVLQYLTYPMLDYRTGSTGPHLYDDAATWTAECNRFGWSALMGGATHEQAVSPYASPAHAENLTGLPPTWISVGALDLFAEECLDFARRLILAGVPTEIQVYGGAFHGFNQVVTADVSRRFQRDQQAALSRAFRLNSGEVT